MVPLVVRSTDARKTPRIPELAFLGLRLATPSSKAYRKKTQRPLIPEVRMGESEPKEPSGLAALAAVTPASAFHARNDEQPNKPVVF